MFEAGLYETLLPDTTTVPSYRLRITHLDGTVTETSDPYSVPPLMTDYDLHLFAEGTLLKAYEHFGAILDDFSMTIQASEVHALPGTNGTGKGPLQDMALLSGGAFVYAPRFKLMPGAGCKPSCCLLLSSIGCIISVTL